MLGKNNLKVSPLYHTVKMFFNYYELAGWIISGSPKNKPAPHLIKRVLVRKLQSETGIGTFIETGTYMGEMVSAVSKSFTTVYTIEIDEKLYHRAKDRFAKQENIRVLLGDSGRLLPKILSDLDEDLILWFDAHYSGGITGKADKETPIEEELGAVFAYEERTKKNCYLLIDDARCFVGKNSYPTIEKIEKLAKDYHKVIKVKNDIIRLLPRE